MWSKMIIGLSSTYTVQAVKIFVNFIIYPLLFNPIVTLLLLVYTVTDILISPTFEYRVLE